MTAQENRQVEHPTSHAGSLSVIAIANASTHPFSFCSYSESGL